MGFDENKEIGEKSGADKEIVNEDNEEVEKFGRKMSENSIYTTDNEHEDEDYDGKIDLGPQYTIKEQLEKDKDDESLRKWKEQLLGGVDLNVIGESLEPEVKILSLVILSPDRPDIYLPMPEDGKPKSPWFTLKEGSRYKLKFTFQVNNNVVLGLKYTNTVWKTGLKATSPYLSRAGGLLWPRSPLGYELPPSFPL
ncbi:rho GDP-dissociation inhibitor 1-like isoform X2 [Amaranthus tricolor]|uniref:rho GDP-dissociation inhibitor 1-like isoform X2 n=1 Tax=Amaranthus tricolor TaxID=29722 RepID=UPI00258EBC5E|nr:rho GDP-dissociation inhibitor 1-like isoform X2 [Amaranthus tricolor]